MNYVYGNQHCEKKLLSILEKNGLENAKNILVKDYSKGMKQRLSLSIIELYNPFLLILDEPTIGLDIVGVNHLKSALKEFKSKGGTVLFTTHDIHFCQEISENVTLINNGQNIDEGTTSEWLSNYKNIENAILDKLKNKTAENLT
ncbi:ATP-binding cassette domain-containing protein [Aeribacillus pallidus]|nr:ATP-binding cassette domain-containing protein [Aeribacillus pallidus]